MEHMAHQVLGEWGELGQAISLIRLNHLSDSASGHHPEGKVFGVGVQWPPCQHGIQAHTQ